MTAQGEMFARDVSPLSVAMETVRVLAARREGVTKPQAVDALSPEAVDVLPVAIERLMSTGELYAARVDIGDEYAPVVFHAGPSDGVG